MVVSSTLCGVVQVPHSLSHVRVLHFYKTCFPDTMGGVEQVIHQIARGTSRLGAKVDVLSLASDPDPETLCSDGYISHRVRVDFEIASTAISFSTFSRFSQLADQADLVHYHFPWPFMDIVHFAARKKKPTLVTYHSDIVRQKRLLKLYRPLQSRFLGSVTRIVATSPNYFSSSPVLRGFADKVAVIPIGLDRSTYPCATEERKNFWRNSVGSKFFLFVGLLRYYKGLHFLLEAAKEARYTIVVVGTGPIELSLKAKSLELGLNNVHFVGHVSDLDRAALLSLSYCVVSPSHLRSEAFGVSLLEGAMHGKPLISTELGTGTTYINIHEQTGLVVPPAKPRELRNAMDYLWDHPGEAAEMGARGAQRYERIFTAEMMAQSYCDLYRELLGSR